MLTDEQHARRENKVTASFLPQLMGGNDEEIYNEWLRLTGDPRYVPKDLSEEWAPSWGAYGEPFILNWHERKTKQSIVRRGEFVNHPQIEHVGCTLDGLREFDNTVLDAKVCNAWQPIDEITAHYTPQIIVQVRCTVAMHGALVLVHGSSEPVEYPIHIDPDYEKILWTRVDQFWQCVETFTPPVEFPRVTPPEQWRSIDLLTDGVNWGQEMKDLLLIWDSLKDSADAHEEATKDIKKILPEDVGKVQFGMLQIKRSKARAVTIKRVKA